MKKQTKAIVKAARKTLLAAFDEAVNQLTQTSSGIESLRTFTLCVEFVDDGLVDYMREQVEYNYEEEDEDDDFDDEEDEDDDFDDEGYQSVEHDPAIGYFVRRSDGAVVSLATVFEVKVLWPSGKREECSIVQRGEEPTFLIKYEGQPLMVSVVGQRILIGD